MSGRSRWSAGFLGATALLLGMELWAAADGDPDTRTWTEHLVTYISPEITFAGIGGLSLWLVYHFSVRYWRKAKKPPAE